jgi:hypothetical protein
MRPYRLSGYLVNAGKMLRTGISICCICNGKGITDK